MSCWNRLARLSSSEVKLEEKKDNLDNPVLPTLGKDVLIRPTYYTGVNIIILSAILCITQRSAVY